MPNWEEERKRYDIPKAAGKAGYFKVLDTVFDLPRVQEVNIVPGAVSYFRFKKSDEPENNADVDLDTVLPYSIIRSRPLIELSPVSENAAVVIAQMFAKAQIDGYNPVAFAGGHEIVFRRWHGKTTGVVLQEGEAYGLPFLVDQNLPIEALFMCAAFGKRASLIDTVQSYKVTMPTTR